MFLSGYTGIDLFGPRVAATVSTTPSEKAHPIERAMPKAAAAASPPMMVV